ncbi:MAG: hypothetical protein EBZ49_11160 [Proteobacteria bacterium]|nr:hypothetical protein [Pseudomonadota bacterium]
MGDPDPRLPGLGQVLLLLRRSVAVGVHVPHDLEDVGPGAGDLDCPVVIFRVVVPAPGAHLAEGGEEPRGEDLEGGDDRVHVRVVRDVATGSDVDDLEEGGGVLHDPVIPQLRGICTGGPAVSGASRRPPGAARRCGG